MFSFVSMIMYRYNYIHYPNWQGLSIHTTLFEDLRQKDVLIWAHISSLGAILRPKKVDKTSHLLPISSRSCSYVGEEKGNNT